MSASLHARPRRWQQPAAARSSPPSLPAAGRSSPLSGSTAPENAADAQETRANLIEEGEFDDSIRQGLDDWI